MSKHVSSCLIMYHHVLSGIIMSYHVLSCLTMTWDQGKSKHEKPENIANLHGNCSFFEIWSLAMFHFSWTNLNFVANHPRFSSSVMEKLCTVSQPEIDSSPVPSLPCPSISLLIGCTVFFPEIYVNIGHNFYFYVNFCWIKSFYDPRSVWTEPFHNFLKVQMRSNKLDGRGGSMLVEKQFLSLRQTECCLTCCRLFKVKS